MTEQRALNKEFDTVADSPADSQSVMRAQLLTALQSEAQQFPENASSVMDLAQKLFTPSETNAHTTAENWEIAIPALENGHAPVLQIMLDAGADLSGKNIDYNLAKKVRNTFVTAAAKGYTDVVPVMASAGFDLKTAHNGQQSLATAAAAHGHVNVLKALRALKVDLSEPAPDGHSPGVIAAGAGQVEVLAFLEKSKVDLGASDGSKWKPSTESAHYDEVAALTFLQEHGYDLSTPDRNGHTPHDVAGDEAKAYLESIGISAAPKPQNVAAFAPAPG
ncbi:MAG: hypothetical protein IT559_06895 [Alphaproteobacteria bacterium]|nr:hypothetical protein [Alphaproteobacteria bacterium]